MSKRDVRGRGLKTAVRASVLSAAVTTSLAIATPAFAVVRDDGDDPGSSLSALDALGIFVGLPVLLFAVIAGLVFLTGDKARSKPGTRR